MGRPSSARRCTRATPGAYVNFVGDEGEARVRAAYPGATWDRLAAIKAPYDPTNLFRLNQNIPPAGSADGGSVPAAMRFRTTILQGGKTATGIRVPDEVVEALGKGKRPARVREADQRVHVSEHRRGHGRRLHGRRECREPRRRRVAGGDVVDVDIELDTAPREVTVPAEFAAALDARPRLAARSRACRTATSPGTCSR